MLSRSFHRPVGNQCYSNTPETFLLRCFLVRKYGVDITVKLYLQNENVFCTHSLGSRSHIYRAIMLQTLAEILQALASNSRFLLVLIFAVVS